MRRDLDLMRTLLLALEAADSSVNVLDLGLENADFPLLAHQAELLAEAGLLRAQLSYADGSATPVYVQLERLTWQGHEFLDLVREDGAWNEVKRVAQTRGVPLTFEVVHTLRLAAVRAALGAAESPPSR